MQCIASARCIHCVHFVLHIAFAIQCLKTTCIPICCPAGVSDALPPDTLQRLLLRVLGDLEAVWADAGLTAVLLGLTLPAIEVLLGCDELQVLGF